MFGGGPFNSFRARYTLTGCSVKWSALFAPAAVALILSGCGGGAGRSPVATTVATTPNPPASSSSTPVSSYVASSYHVSGIVTGDDGIPIAGARLMFQYLDFIGTPGTFPYKDAIVYTDANGAYIADFPAIAGTAHGPTGTETAFAYVDIFPGGDYDYGAHYVLAPSASNADHQVITQDLQLRRRTRITAGDSIVVTISPGDDVCENFVQDSHPWPAESVCRTVHISVPKDGMLTVEALENESGVVPALEIEWPGGPSPCCLVNPQSFFVPAGTDVKAQLEMPWGTPLSSFLLKTSFVPQ